MDVFIRHKNYAKRKRGKLMISIIITAYNVENYINNCINSILSQTYSDLEIIVVDDGSTDSTGGIVKNIYAEQQNIKYFYQPNAGVSVARNKGIENATGDFLVFVDGDDALENTMIETLYSNVENTTDIVACCCVGFNEDEESINRFYDNDLTIRTVNEKEKLYLQLMKTERGQPSNQKIFTAIGVPWGKLYRTSLLKQKKINFNPSLRRMQDNIFNMYCFRAAREIKYVNQPLYRYRINHITGYTRAYTPEAYYLVLQERELFFKSFPEYQTESIMNGFFIEKMDYYLSSIKNLCLSYSYDKAKFMVKRLGEKKLYKEIIYDIKPQKCKKLNMVNFMIKNNCIRILYCFINLKTRKKD